MRPTLLVLLSIFLINTLHAQDMQYKSPLPKFTPYQNITVGDTNENLTYEVRELGLDQPARWLSVDPMADKYPGWSPYNYTMCNPMKYVDPNGMWVPEYDKEKNTVTAKYEKGDTYENLYTQMEMTSEQFAKQFGVDLSQGISDGTSFDITSQVFSDGNFDPNATNSNCFGFVVTATGRSSEEGQTQGRDFMSTMGGLSQTGSHNTGNIGVWSYSGNITGIGDLGNVSGSPAHAGIFVLKNQSGEAFFMNRGTLGATVTINTEKQIINNYNLIRETTQNNFNRDNPGNHITLPNITNQPTYYK